ncbi:MAG: DUF2075 domain-containing protein, partial [Thermoleophilia bacterium]|nr:DUF2075 domain-containing protein [Thermoleophilia bacterium]
MTTDNDSRQTNVHSGAGGGVGAGRSDGTQRAGDACCGWHGTVADFLALDQAALLASLAARHLRVMGAPPSGEQIAAWRGEYEILGVTLREIAASVPRAGKWAVIFEYELPRERGRRPDVVILTGSQVVVLEFKETAAVQHAHVDQVAAYARDLRHYHAASHDKLVDPVLVLTGATEARRTAGDVTVVNPRGLGTVIAELERRAPAEPIDAEGWLAADYSPLPSLVDAARRIFEHEPLPQIKRAQSAGIPGTIAALVAAANQAHENRELHLALITGVPGSGKTLVGLQFVYENHFGDTGSHRTAIFLSGNGPLVDVLQYALRSRVFVQDVHGFLKQYGGDSTRTPEEHIWVYDEAQRAWDAQRVREKRGHDRSEPEDFLSIGSRKDSWALMVGLIGEGQEIYLGEEAGLKQWNDAIAKTADSWTVHSPRKIADLFDSAERLDINESLDLDMSLRTHLAEDVQGWVEDLLDGRLDAAAAHAEAMEKQGFRLYLTRELERATGYVRERYRSETDKRYGFLGSSKGRLNPFGIPTDYYSTQRMKIGPWYYDDPDTAKSCC